MLKMATFKTSKWMGVQRDHLDIKSKAEISDLMISKKPPDSNTKRIPISPREDLKIKLTYFPHTEIEFTRYKPGNALALVQRVQKHVDLWDINFCSRRYWGF